MNINEIHEQIKLRFNYYTKNNITNNSVMDLYALAIADVLEKLYIEIEAAKMPHLYTKLNEKSLDDLGFLLATPREINESDAQYLYRLMNWKYSAESSNSRAINTALLNRTYASHAEYIPMTNGSGTGTVYIIPKTYDEREVVGNSIKECIEVMQKISSKSVYVEYVVPEPRGVTLHIGITFDELGDKDIIKSNIESLIKEYVNNIPPNRNLLVGEINKIGVKHDYVKYFTLLQAFIGDKETKSTEILQRLEDKYLLKEIIWSEE